jgi:hypothetical protein
LPTKNDWGVELSQGEAMNYSKSKLTDIIYQSSFIRYQAALGFGSTTRNNDKSEFIGMSLFNSTLREFVQIAYSDILTNVPISRIRMNVKKELLFNDVQDTANLYC